MEGRPGEVLGRCNKDQRKSERHVNGGDGTVRLRKGLQKCMNDQCSRYKEAKGGFISERNLPQQLETFPAASSLIFWVSQHRRFEMAIPYDFEL